MVNLEDFPKKGRSYSLVEHKGSGTSGGGGGGFLGGFFGIKNPILWILALIILFLFLTGGAAGGFEAFAKFGQALKSIPTWLWALLIIVFFWRFSIRGGSRR